MNPRRFAVPVLFLNLITLVAPLTAQNVTVFASGLNGPRGLTFGPDGALYVAEAGLGGSTLSATLDCAQVPAPVGPYFGGPTARISKITGPGQVSTLVDGLPSAKSSLPSGDTEGASGVAFVGKALFALLAGGGCSHGNPDAPNGVVQIDAANGSWKYVADLSAFEKANPAGNPAPSIADFEPDGTWYGMVAVRGDLYVTEPNHQHIDRISPATGKIERIVDVSISSESYVGPTGITWHGDFYFGNLGPFPVDPGTSNVFKLAPSGEFKPWRNGLTTVVGLAFDNRDRLYVLELSDAAGFPAAGAGKLVRIDPSGEAKDIVTGLVVPTAMTIGPDGAIYISNFGAAPPGLGQILRVEVAD